MTVKHLNNTSNMYLSDGLPISAQYYNLNLGEKVGETGLIE